MIPENIQINPSYGELNNQVDITVGSYSGRLKYPPRELYCYTDDNTAYDMIEIEQSGKQEFIAINEPLSYTVAATGGTITITGISNSAQLILKGINNPEYKVYINDSLVDNWNGYIPNDIGATNEYSFKFEITIPDNRTEQQKIYNLYFNNGGSINTGYITVTQNKGVKTYGNITINTFTYSPSSIPASGGTATPSVSYSLSWGWNGNTTNGGTITTGATLSYSGTNVNTNNGSVTVSSKGTTISDKTLYTTSTVKISIGDKTASKSCSIYQDKNIILSCSYTDKGAIRYDPIPASGGSSKLILTGKFDRIWLYSSGSTYNDRGVCPSGYSWRFPNNTTIASNKNGFSINGNNVVAQNRGTTIGNQWESDIISLHETGTITPNPENSFANVVTISYVCTATCTQEKNVPVSIDTLISLGSTPVYYFDNSSIPASGGTSTGLTSTYYDCTWSSGSVSRHHSGFDDPSGVSTTSSNSFSTIQSSSGATISLISPGKVTWASRGTTTGDARSVIIRRTFTIYLTIDSTYGGGSLSSTKTCDATSTQAANSVSYGDITISGTPSVSDIPASGGSVNSASGLSASQTISYTSGSSTSSSVPITYNTVTASSLGATLKVRSSIGTLVATATANGKTSTKNITVYQAKNTIVSATTDFRFSYPKSVLSTSGETINRILNDLGFNGTLSSGSTIWERDTITGFTKSSTEIYSMTASTGWSINTTTGAVTVTALPQGSSSRTSGTIKGTASWVLTDTINNNTINTSTSYTVGTLQQSGNTVVSTKLVISAASWDTWWPADQYDSISPTREFLCIQGSRVYTYSDGSTSTDNLGLLSWSNGLNTNVDWCKAWTNGGAYVESRGAIIGNSRSGEIWWTENGLESNHISFTQLGNYVKSISVTTNLSYSKNISAAGGSVSPTRGTSYIFTFTSGATSNSISTTYGTTTVTYSYTGSAATGFTAPNSSTGVMTASSRGTTAGSARNSGTVTQTATVKFVHASTYSSGGTITGSKTASDYATQVANAVTSTVYGNPVISGLTTPISLNVTGQTYTISPRATQSVTYTYTSGQQSTGSLTVSSFSYSVVTAVSGYSLSSNKVTVTNNTTTSARNGYIVKVTATGNSKSSTYNITFNQAAGYKTYSGITVSLSYSTISASGGTVSPSLSYSQTWGWNGSTTGGGTITSGGNISYTKQSGNASMNTSGQVTATSRGTTVDSANTTAAVVRVTVTLNGKSATKDATVYQTRNQATTITYGNWIVSVVANQYITSGSPCPASGGSCTITSSAYRTRVQNYTSGATSALSNETGTPTLSISGTGASLSGNTATWASRGTTAGNLRSATITASYGGVSATEVIYQQANVQTIVYGDWQVSISSNNNFTSSNPCPASGGSTTISHYAYRTRHYSYTSGATSSLSNETGTTTLSLNDTNNGCSITGNSAVNWQSRDNVVGAIRSVQVKATHTSGAYSFIQVYQAANVLSYIYSVKASTTSGNRTIEAAEISNMNYAISITMGYTVTSIYDFVVKLYKTEHYTSNASGSTYAVTTDSGQFYYISGTSTLGEGVYSITNTTTSNSSITIRYTTRRVNLLTLTDPSISKISISAGDVTVVLNIYGYYIYSNTSSLTFAATGATNSIIVVSNTPKVRGENTIWITPNTFTVPLSKGSGNVALTAAANNDTYGNTRTGVISLSTKESDLTYPLLGTSSTSEIVYNINATQSATDYYFTISPTSVPSTSTTGSFTITFRRHKNGSFITSNPTSNLTINFSFVWGGYQTKTLYWYTTQTSTSVIISKTTGSSSFNISSVTITPSTDSSHEYIYQANY